MVRIVKFLIVPVCVGTGATLLVLLRQTTYGGGFTTDSSLYINIARDLVNGYGIKDTLWFIPPGFPSLLALVSVFGPDPREAAPFVNATAFGLTVAVAGIWFRIHIKSRILVVWGTCAVASSTALSFPSTIAWTEAPFCLFVVLSLFSLDRYLSTCNRRVHPEKRERPREQGMFRLFSSSTAAWLVLAAIFAAMATLTRWMGVTVIAAGSLLLLIRRRKPFVARIRSFIAYTVVAAVPVSTWMTGYFLYQDSSFRYSYPSDGGGKLWRHNLCTTAGEFTEWAIGRFGSGYLGKLLFACGDVFDWTTRNIICIPQLGLLSVFALGATYLLRDIRGGGRIKQRAALAPPVTFALIYMFALYISLPLTDIRMQIRYLAPLYVPLLFVAAIALNEGYHRVTSKNMINLSSLAIITSLFLWTSQQLYVNYKDIDSWLTRGAPYLNENSSQHYLYTSKYWRTSELIRYIKNADVEGRLWGTNAGAISRLTDIPIARFPVRLQGRVADWPAEVLAPGTVLAWHWERERHFPDYAYGPQELLDALPSLEVDRVFSDGIVLKISAAGPSRRSPNPRIILDSLLQNTMQVISAYYDIYLHKTQNRLIYVKKQCGENRTNAPILLRVFPVNDFDLPRYAVPIGFGQYDFVFDRRTFRWGDDCLAMISLPGYEISRFWTGQTSNEEAWEVSLIRSSEGGWRVLG